MNIKYLCLFLLISLSSQVFPQHPTNTRVTVYQPFQASDTLDITQIKIDRNCVKWNMALLCRGVFTMSMERMLSQSVSVEAGVGVTYRDWIFETARELSNSDFSFGNDLNISLGPFISGSMRWYPKAGDLEGIYVSPFIRYRQYNINTAEGSLSSEPDVPIGYKMNESGLLFGIQRMSLAWDVTWEYYIGVGMSYSSFKQPGTDHLGAVSWEHKKRKSPMFYVGYTIGLPF